MKTNKILILLMTGILSLTTLQVQSQLPVTDVASITQNMTNSIVEVAELSTTATNVINTFKETKKIYEQGKEYYDKLKKVSNLVKDAAKVQKTILMVGEIADIYVANYEKMMTDKNYSVRELTAIASGYAKLMQEGADVLKELREVVNVTDMSMTDKERIDLIDRSYNTVRHYRDLTAYYTRKHISVSYIRAKKSGDLSRVMQLYGKDERYW